MKKVFSIRLLIVIISLLPAGRTHGCWFLNGPQDYRFWLLNPIVLDKVELSPFYFSSYYFFNSSETIFDAESTHYNQNVGEWYQYLQQKARWDDIYDAQYKIGTDSFFTNEDELARTNTFVRLLHKKKYSRELEYFKLAKKLEDLSSFDLGANGIDRQLSRDTNAFAALITKAEQLYGQASNSMLRARIAYQLIRLHLFNGSYAKGKKVYTEQFLPVVDRQSWLYGAGMFFQSLLADTMRSADYYQMSRAFYVSLNKRAAVARRIPTDSIGAILKYAENDHERAVIHTIRAIQYPGRSLDEIRLIYRLEPANKDIAFLLMREVSKLEDWLKTPVYTNHTLNENSYLESGESQYSFDKTNYSKDSLYGLAVHAFIDSVAEKIKGKAVAHICAAQLSLLMNDPYDATMHLQAAEKKKLTAAQVYYIKVAHLLCDVLREPVLSRHTETALLELFDKGKKNPYVIEPGIFTEQLKLFVANVLITKGDTARGIFLMARTSRCIGALPINFVANAYTRLAEIGTPAVYDQMLALFYKHNKSAFERYITIPRILNIPWLGSDHEITEQDLNDPVKWNPGMFLNLKAQWFINRDRLEEALAVYDGVPDSVWNDKIYRGYMTGNPVQPKILPYKVAVTTGCDTSIHSITRPDMLAALIQMKKQLRTQRGDEKARTCLRIAGAYFQMSYYGEYWIMNRIFWSANDSPEQQNDFNSMYFGCSLAGQWYREAEKWAATEPVASSAAFMARYCDKLYARYITTVQKNSYWVDLSYSSSTRNRELEKRFKRHPTYDDMISECH